MAATRTVSTREAPTPAGHYSQAVVHNGLVFVAAQLPVSVERPGQVVGGSAAAQAEQALRNVLAIVRAAGSDVSRILKVTVYLADTGDWDEVNAVYARVMGEHKPARAMIPTGRALHLGALVGVEAIAAVD